MRRMLATIAATAGLAVALVAAPPASAGNATNQAERLFTKWANSLAKSECGDGARMGRLYRPGGVLLATFDEIVQGRDNIIECFDGLTCLEDLSVEATLFRSGGEGRTLWATGLYTFSFTEDGQIVEVPARFTYVWKANRKGVFRIATHHSSVSP